MSSTKKVASGKKALGGNLPFQKKSSPSPADNVPLSKKKKSLKEKTSLSTSTASSLRGITQPKSDLKSKSSTGKTGYSYYKKIARIAGTRRISSYAIQYIKAYSESVLGSLVIAAAQSAQRAGRKSVTELDAKIAGTSHGMYIFGASANFKPILLKSKKQAAVDDESGVDHVAAQTSDTTLQTQSSS